MYYSGLANDTHFPKANLRRAKILHGRLLIVSQQNFFLL
jgi:hypothetical protein